MDRALGVFDEIDEAGFHGAEGAEFGVEVGVFLGDVGIADLLGFKVAEGAEFEEEPVEVVGGDAEGDGAADFAVGEFVGGGGGDETAFFAGDGGDGGEGVVEGTDFEFDGAVADDFAFGDFGGIGIGWVGWWRVRGRGLRGWGRWRGRNLGRRRRVVG